MHGAEEADRVLAAARNIFSGGDTAHMPSTQFTDEDLQDGQIGLLTLLVKCGLASSNREARQLVQQGSVLLDGVKAEDPFAKITLTGEIIIKKGRKVFHKAVKA